jgi:hypothetical protein
VTADVDLANQLLGQVVGSQHLRREADREFLVQRDGVGIVDGNLGDHRQSRLALDGNGGGRAVARRNGRDQQEGIRRAHGRVALAASAGAEHAGHGEDERPRAAQPYPTFPTWSKTASAARH